MIRLRPFRKTDAKYVISWTSKAEEFYKWSAGLLGDFPVSEERLLEAISAREDNDRYFVFTAFDESGPVGFFTVRTPGEDDRVVRFGFVIVNPSKRGMGYGKQMLSLALKYIFEIYGAKEVALGVFENNKQAYNCYRAVGFRENGERPEYDICGENWVDIEMSVKKGI